MTAVTTMLDRLTALSEKAKRLGGRVNTTEVTKTALVMPFIVALGYDVFDPEEVIPAFGSEGEALRLEPVDYAIKRNGQVIMLIETQTLGSDLAAHEPGSLERCFSATSARVLLLTNGARYAFFSDLENPGTLDARPFLDLDLLTLDASLVSEVSRLAKDVFDPDEWAAS